MREAENKIHADVFDPGVPQDAEGLAGARSVVAAVHPAEDPVVERLHAHADAVDSQFQQPPDIRLALLHDILRIHLDGKFFEAAGQSVPRGSGA